jgi:hypothetical protein
MAIGLVPSCPVTGLGQGVATWGIQAVPRSDDAGTGAGLPGALIPRLGRDPGSHGLPGLRPGLKDVRRPATLMHA